MSTLAGCIRGTCHRRFVEDNMLIVIDLQDPTAHRACRGCDARPVPHALATR
jgi:hypothetical protein